CPAPRPSPPRVPAVPSRAGAGSAPTGPVRAAHRRAQGHVGPGGPMGGGQPDAGPARGTTRPGPPRPVPHAGEAAINAICRRLDAGGNPHMEIMIPLVSTVEELRRMRAMIEKEIVEARERTGHDLEVPIGTMIELPRAA